MESPSAGSAYSDSVRAESVPSFGSSRWLLLLAAVLIVGANMRVTISVVGPLLEQIGADTGLSPAALGVLGAMPVFSFAVVAPFVHVMGARFGAERTVLYSLLALALGTVVRSLVPHEMALYAGTLILAGAIGVLNVLLPAVIREDFPGRVPLVTGLFTGALSLFAALSAALAVPAAERIGWELTMAAGSVLALMGAGAWVLRPGTERRGSRAGHEAEPVPPTTTATPSSPRTAMWRHRIAWHGTIFFGTQSLLFFLMLTWFPAIQTYHGYTPGEAGVWSGVHQGIGIVASLLLGPLMQRSRDHRAIGVLVPALMVLGLVGIIFLPGLMPVWAVACGFSSGASLLISLTLISVRVRQPEDTGRLSGMAQGVGYLFAATGPVVAGWIFEQAESWIPVLWMAVGVAVLQGVSGWAAGRHRHIEG